MLRLLRSSLAVLLLAASGVPAVAATPSPAATAPLVKELAALLEQQKLDSIAARLDGDTFVAALYFPGAELLAVCAKYSAPALLNERILGRHYKDAFSDLSGASVVSTKVLIEDSHADGIRLNPGKEAFDIVTRANDAPVHLDGKWKDKKMTEEAYGKLFQDAESDYRKMLEALIAELKKAPR
jgi:hypothetical protein